MMSMPKKVNKLGQIWSGNMMNCTGFPNNCVIVILLQHLPRQPDFTDLGRLAQDYIYIRIRILMVVFVFHQVIVRSDDGKSRVFGPDAFEWGGWSRKMMNQGSRGRHLTLFPRTKICQAWVTPSINHEVDHSPAYISRLKQILVRQFNWLI